MNAVQYRRWLTDRLREAMPLDRPSELQDPRATAEEATKRLALLGLGSGALIRRGCEAQTVADCAAVIADCLAALPQDPNAPSPAMSVVEVAGILGVSKETVYRLCSDRRLDHNRTGARITITQQQLADFQAG